MVPAVGHGQVPEWLAQCFVRAVAGQSGEGRVDPLDDGLAIRDDDGVTGGVQRGTLKTL